MPKVSRYSKICNLIYIRHHRYVIIYQCHVVCHVMMSHACLGHSSFNTTTTSCSPPPWMPCACHIMAVGNGDGNTDPHLLLDHTATPNDEDKLTHHLMVTDMATATSAIISSGNSNLCCHPLPGCPLLPHHGNGSKRIPHNKCLGRPHFEI